MINDDLMHEVREICYYRNQALSMINIYNPETEGLFYKWLNEFEYVANMIEVPDNKMGNFFITMVHDDVLKKIKKIYPSVNFSKLSYDEILTKYLYLFIVNKEFSFHRCRFLHRNQYVKEPMQKYSENLRKIFNNCRYTSCTEKILCQRFLRGIRDDDMRIYLSNSSHLSFDQIVVRATEFEKFNLITYYLDQAILKIKTYNPQKEGQFYVWLNKFEYVADLIEVPDDNMIEFFYNMVDNEVHTYILKAYSSVNFSKLSYEEIINHYLRYFDPGNESDVHRKRFQCRDQYEKETVAIYADNLEKIHNKCEEGSSFEEELCEKFINGILDKYIRNFLSKMPGLSFDGLVIMAIGFENEINSIRGIIKS